MRERLAQWLRKTADRLHHPSAPKLMGWSFTFERGVGIVFNDQGRGCRLAYFGDDEYARAHDEAGCS